MITFLSNIDPSYVGTFYVVVGLIALFIATRVLQKLVAWVNTASKPQAYNPKLSRAARESLMRDGIKPEIRKYNNTYRATRNRSEAFYR